MENYFKLKNIVDLNVVNKDTKIFESDFCHITDQNKMYQFELIEEESNRSIEVNPGLYKIAVVSNVMKLEEAHFTADEMLNEYTNTEHIEHIIECFFKNLHLYKEFGIEVPKRNLLLYGPPGGGKSTAIQKAAMKYVGDGKTAVITWDTAAFEPYEIKEFISRLNYIGAEKIILIAEDIGGASNEGLGIRSSSSLLRLLDNTDKTFTIPVMVIATTNFIGNLEENLANRSGRFDDRIEIGYPSSEDREKLLRFFAKEYVTEKAAELIKTDKCKKFSVAHIKECYIRSRLHSKDLDVVIKQVIKEIEEYNKGFTKN